MDWLEFTSQMTSALAWPVLTVVIVLILRTQIVKMLSDVALKRIKAGPFEAEWDRVLASTESQVNQVAIGEDPPRVIEGELAQDVRVAPAVAVLEAFSTIERQLRDIIGGRESTSGRGAVMLAKMAVKHELISDASLRSIQGLSVLRNLVAHGSAQDVTSEQAEEYLVLADAVLYALQEEQRGRSATPEPPPHV